jgi:hypothetical protein
MQLIDQQHEEDTIDGKQQQHHFGKSGEQPGGKGARGRKSKKSLLLTAANNSAANGEFTSYHENDEIECKPPNGKRFKSETTMKTTKSPSNNNNNSNTSKSAKKMLPLSRSASVSSGGGAAAMLDQSKLDANENDDDYQATAPIELVSGIQPELLIHGGFGVKNPEYEALNNDIDLFSAVEIIDDPENKYKCKICHKTFKLQRLMNRHMKNHSNIKR